ncbi:uncharacterized protein LOC121993213 isoform X2 [Zingiber officinale]|uniref:uncharacterized protein LOC121993213 isoform X2 n=1 Tax=Zingiber officinale TaxID=94328 RepID=UPI001C4AA7CA|nr:uncharacterized protein LOC121993213 isoform X2 [Zingiber officinale]
MMMKTEDTQILPKPCLSAFRILKSRFLTPPGIPLRFFDHLLRLNLSEVVIAVFPVVYARRPFFSLSKPERQIEKQGEVLMEAYRSMSHELHRLQRKKCSCRNCTR